MINWDRIKVAFLIFFLLSHSADKSCGVIYTLTTTGNEAKFIIALAEHLSADYILQCIIAKSYYVSGCRSNPTIQLPARPLNGIKFLKFIEFVWGRSEGQQEWYWVGNRFFSADVQTARELKISLALLGCPFVLLITNYSFLLGCQKGPYHVTPTKSCWPIGFKDKDFLKVFPMIILWKLYVAMANKNPIPRGVLWCSADRFSQSCVVIRYANEDSRIIT